MVPETANLFLLVWPNYHGKISNSSSGSLLLAPKSKSKGDDLDCHIFYNEDPQWKYQNSKVNTHKLPHEIVGRVLIGRLQGVYSFGEQVVEIDKIIKNSMDNYTTKKDPAGTTLEWVEVAVRGIREKFAGIVDIEEERPSIKTFTSTMNSSFRQGDTKLKDFDLCRKTKNKKSGKD